MPRKKQIYVTSGTSQGQTQLAAFDAALLHAGVANFSLIKLSSVIPPNCQVKVERPDLNTDQNYGKKLFVVISEKHESEKGREAWAGIGWVQAKDGRGLFVEQKGAQQAEVMRLIKDTLNDMTKNRHHEYGEIHYQVVGVHCEEHPVCALVVAVYEIEDWQ